MTTSPYTHPSMPGTSYRDWLTPLPREQEAAAHVLSAALEDAEGHALVEKILADKEVRNAAEKARQLMLFGEYFEDEAGWVIPRETPEYWKELAAASTRLAEAHGNRKLNEQMAAKVSAIHDIPGVTPHGSNDPQVP